MKLKLLIFVMVLAAMGPARNAPPDTAVAAQEDRPANPAEAPEPERAELRILGAAEADPAEFLWQARPVVVFADSENDPAFLQQMRGLEGSPSMLIERDVVVVIDTDPEANGVWRQQLHPRGFSVVIIDKDGQVKLRKPLPWDAREISRAIDKFPLRRQEIGRASLP